MERGGKGWDVTRRGALAVLLGSALMGQGDWGWAGSHPAGRDAGGDAGVGSEVGYIRGGGREGQSLSKAVWRPSQLEHLSGEAGQQLGTLLIFPILGQVGLGHR